METFAEPPPTTPKYRRKRLTKRFLIATFCLLALALVIGYIARAMLIDRMMLPRLTLTQEGYVMGVAMSPDGRTVVSGQDTLDVEPRPKRLPQADVVVWDVNTGHLVRRLHGLWSRSNIPVISPDGRHVLASGETIDKIHHKYRSTISAWDLQTGQSLWQTEGEMPLTYSPDGKTFAYSLNIKTHIYRYHGFIGDAHNGKRIIETSHNVKEDGQSKYLPDGNTVGIIDTTPINPTTGFNDYSQGLEKFYSTNILRLWNASNGRHIKDYPFIRASAFDVSHAGKWLILICEAGLMTGGTDGSVVRRVDTQTGKVLWTRTRSVNGENPDKDAVLSTVVVSPNGKYIVEQSMNSGLIVLDANTGRELFRPTVIHDDGSPGWIMPGGVAFSPDGRTLVSRSGKNVLVWDASVLK